MTSIYRPILKNAWQILWRAKYLWFFGLFAVLIVNSGEVNLIIDNFSSLAEQSSFLRDLKVFYLQGSLGNFGANWQQLVANFNWASLLLIILIAAFFIFLLWLAVVSQVGLISGAYKKYRKQLFGFKMAFKTGQQNFWQVLGLNVLGRVIIYGILFIVGLPLGWLYLSQNSEIAQAIFMFLAFLIMIPLAVIVSFLIKYAVIFSVLKKDSFSQAIKNAWHLFAQNWIVSIEMAILMFLVAVAGGIVMILSSLVLAIPLSLLFYVFYVLNVGGLLMLSIVIAMIMFIALLVWIGALLSTYQMTSWVLLFDRLTENQVYAKVTRLVNGLTMKKSNKGLEQ
ncbi:hypothetical protein ACFL1Y_01570 [Patescibacteria group bacterium]